MTVAMKPNIADFGCTILSTGRGIMSDEDKKLGFRDKVTALYPEAQASRLARLCDVQQRTAQKWLAGDIPIPEEVTTWVDAQYAAVAKSPHVADLEALMEKWREAGIDDSVIAAHISRIYGDLTGMQIR